MHVWALYELPSSLYTDLEMLSKKSCPFVCIEYSMNIGQDVLDSLRTRILYIIYMWLWVYLYISDRLLCTLGVPDEFHCSQPGREYNTTKFKLSLPIFWNQVIKHEKYEEIKRKIGGEVEISTVKWLKSKLHTVKHSIFGCEYRLTDNPPKPWPGQNISQWFCVCCIVAVTLDSSRLRKKQRQ